MGNLCPCFDGGAAGSRQTQMVSFDTKRKGKEVKLSGSTISGTGAGSLRCKLVPCFVVPASFLCPTPAVYNAHEPAASLANPGFRTVLSPCRIIAFTTVPPCDRVMVSRAMQHWRRQPYTRMLRTGRIG